MLTFVKRGKEYFTDFTDNLMLFKPSFIPSQMTSDSHSLHLLLNRLSRKSVVSDKFLEFLSSSLSYRAEARAVKPFEFLI